MPARGVSGELRSLPISFRMLKAAKPRSVVYRFAIRLSGRGANRDVNLIVDGRMFFLGGNGIYRDDGVAKR